MSAARQGGEAEEVGTPRAEAGDGRWQVYVPRRADAVNPNRIPVASFGPATGRRKCKRRRSVSPQKHREYREIQEFWSGFLYASVVHFFLLPPSLTRSPRRRRRRRSSAACAIA